MNLFYQPRIDEGLNYLDPTESKHSVRVLRQRTGDTIHITDGKGILYDAVITSADPVKCLFKVTATHVQPTRDYRIHVALSVLKSPDRMEWFVEKSIEFGVDAITLLECEHTEKHHFKMDRLQKIAVSAMKQSLSLQLPTLSSPVSFPELIETATETQKFIAHVDAAHKVHLQSIATPLSSYLVLIGPEGDFSAAEVAQATGRDFAKVSLGMSRLRSETAGIAACHILNLVNSR